MQENILIAKQQFFADQKVTDGIIRAEILESWERSKDYGLLPDNADKRVLSKGELNERIQKRRGFYKTAVPLMESLHLFTTGSGFLTVVSDEEGYVLKAIGDKEIMDVAKKNALVEGCNRSERKLGTNAIGTPLVTGKPLQVFGHEHYYDLHTNWVCSGAPIFDAVGSVCGVFCIIGTPENVSFHTLGMAAAAAEAISRQIRMQAAHRIIERGQKNIRAIIEHMPSGLLLINSKLTIIEANKKAELLLGLTADKIIGHDFYQVFGIGSIAERELRNGTNDRYITLKINQKELTISLTSIPAESGEYVITFEMAEALHKKVNKIVGADAHFSFNDIIGESNSLKSTIELAKIAAENNSSVLLTGESGTGKELFAQSIHNMSSRSSGPFVAINCGAIPKSLIESELFGYESGSFTGAKKNGSAGKFELANGGTIFLDEIGDMPFDVQVSLLRVLQNREVMRIGSNKTIKIDVRIIAATNQNLQKAIENNEFRSDLYYRLNVFNIAIPPLRNRLGDVRLLADYFLEKYKVNSSHSVKGFTEEVYEALEAYEWPGNVRQLENVVERGVYIAVTGYIDQKCLPENILPSKKTNSVQQPNITASTLKENERIQIENALKKTDGNVKKAAELLGISRKTIYRKFEQYNINPVNMRN
ncbi:sigma 54-interacting transcriptional regulator [Tyzzerella sp. OttesenSCG-928-J15]|nr:sigma 54-interacting transcriptional regulator [Tyzzerella sp. OttesenSCG-928-J15]